MIRPTLKQVSIVVVGVTLLSTLSCVNSSDPVEMAEPKLVWSAEIPLGYSNLVMPLIDRGRAYVGSDTSLSCFDITTGNRLWRKSLQGSGSIGGTKVLGSDDAIFINNSNTVWAFHRETGNVIWKTSTADFRSLDLEALFQTSTHLFLGGHGEVMRIAKSTGNVDLRIPVTQLIPGGLKQSASDPVVSESDKRLYVPTGYFPGDTLKGNLLCFDSETGQYLWGYSPPSFTVFDIQSCVLSDSLVIFPSGYSMICLNRFTGATLWISTVSQDAFWSSPTISGETVYMGSTAQARMYAFDIRSGAQKWRSRGTQSSIITFITVLNGKVFFCDMYQLWILDAATGNVLWKGDPPERPDDPRAMYTSPVAIGEGYMVVVGNKKIYCLTAP